MSTTHDHEHTSTYPLADADDRIPVPRPRRRRREHGPDRGPWVLRPAGRDVVHRRCGVCQSGYWALPSRNRLYCSERCSRAAHRCEHLGRTPSTSTRWRRARGEHAAAVRRAGRAVEDAVAAGRLVRPEGCEQCGASARPVEAHHWSYDPGHHLVIQWLCRRCHAHADAARRRWERGEAPANELQHDLLRAGIRLLTHAA